MSNTPRKTQVAKVSSAAQWKAANRGTPLPLPSGQTALVKAPGLQVFIQEGVIPNSLLPIVTEALSKGKAPSQRQIEEGMSMDKIRDMVFLFDAVTVFCVVEPKVQPIPPEDEERDDDLLYVDEVDFNDKMFIFQYAVGGTRDVQKFLHELETGVANVSDDESDAVSTE